MIYVDHMRQIHFAPFKNVSMKKMVTGLYLARACLCLFPPVGNTVLSCLFPCLYSSVNALSAFLPTQFAFIWCYATSYSSTTLAVFGRCIMP